MQTNPVFMINANPAKQFQSKGFCGDLNLAVVCISVPVFIDVHELDLFLSLTPRALSGCP